MTSQAFEPLARNSGDFVRSALPRSCGMRADMHAQPLAGAGLTVEVVGAAADEVATTAMAAGAAEAATGRAPGAAAGMAAAT